MRRVAKLPIPAILQKKAATWLAAFLTDRGSDNKKLKYRHKQIKTALRQETGWKCVYCESKIGHNTPGDIEHKIPSSKDPNLHFEWTNLTVACTECNRRKLDYYVAGSAFLDPYVDDVDACLLHLGPFVNWQPGNARAEVAIRKLELDISGQRPELVDRKKDVLEKARALLENVATAGDPLLKMLREDELRQMCVLDAEYSAMVRTYVGQAVIPAAPIPQTAPPQTPVPPAASAPAGPTKPPPSP